MSSIWSSGATTSGASPFATTGLMPTPGGDRATRFQSALQSAGESAQPASSTLGLSPKATASQTVGATPADSSTGSSGSDSGSTISANDFLTLLVTEMQNQDPTAQTDPNEYINQLVQINSLEQLISINQNLAEVLGAATSPVTPTTNAAPNVGTTTTTAAGGGASTGRSGAVRGSMGHASMGASPAGNATSKTASAAHGNLSLPKPSPASRTVAHALDGHTRPGHPGHAIRDIPTQALAR